jgi:hypothetical protein
MKGRWEAWIAGEEGRVALVAGWRMVAHEMGFKDNGYKAKSKEEPCFLKEFARATDARFGDEQSVGVHKRKRQAVKNGVTTRMTMTRRSRSPRRRRGQPLRRAR